MSFLKESPRDARSTTTAGIRARISRTLSMALAVKRTGDGTAPVSVGDVTVTQMPLHTAAVRLRICDPNAPVLSQARTRTVCVPTDIVTLALMELTLFWLNESTLST